MFLHGRFMPGGFQRRIPIRSLLLHLVAILPLYPANYYVAPSGSDANTGTLESPFLSLAHAHQQVAPGDTIYLRGGEYFPREKTVFSRQGEASAPIVLAAYPGEHPLINGRDIPEGNINHASTATWAFEGARHWKINGPLTLTNGRGAGVYIADVRYLTFTGVESSYNGKRASRAAHGFMVWSGDDILFENCDAHHNANHLWKEGENQAENQYQHGDGWRIFSGANIRLHGCRAWNNLDDNFDFYSADQPIELMDAWAAYAGRDDASGSITGVPGKSMPLLDPWDLLWGNGIKLGYWEDSVAHKVVRSLSWANNGAGFHMNLGPAVVWNSAAYGNKVRGFDYTDGDRHEMINNWAFGNAYEDPGYPLAEPDGSLSSHNSWEDDMGLTVSETDFASLEDSAMFGPRQADGGLPGVRFLTLNAGSSLIDAGLDVGLPFKGSAPDLGAFEAGDSLTALPGARKPPLPGRMAVVNYPNPFNPVTHIRIDLPVAAEVSAVIYDLAGRQVVRLFQGYRPAGRQQFSWNATGRNGRKLSGGVYFLTVRSTGHAKTVKLIYMP